jgi:hypothetical protein
VDLQFGPCGVVSRRDTLDERSRRLAYRRLEIRERHERVLPGLRHARYTSAGVVHKPFVVCYSARASHSRTVLLGLRARTHKELHVLGEHRLKPCHAFCVRRRHQEERNEVEEEERSTKHDGQRKH